MTKPILQSLTFPASARELYDIFISPKRHAAFTGRKVKISATPGSAFSAFDGILTGKMLFTLPGQLIAQRWRSRAWKKSDPDSLLVLTFTDLKHKKSRIDLFHLNVPLHDHQGVTQGWKKYYWLPLKAYLRKT